MKRLLALGLALWMLCGCGKTGPAEKQPAVVEAPVEEKEEVSAVEEQAMEPVVLYDDGTYALSVVDFRQSAEWGARLAVELRNGSGQEAVFRLRHAVVNGVMCDPGWSQAVAAGETAAGEIWWTPSLFAAGGIGAMQSLTADLVLPDGRTARFTAQLPGEGEARIAVPETGFAPVLLAEGEDFSVTVTDFDEENRTLTLHLVNESEDDLMFAAEQVTVGSEAWDPGWAMVVLPETEAYARVVWDGAGAFGEIAFLLRVYDQNDAEREDLFAGMVAVDEN